MKMPQNLLVLVDSRVVVNWLNYWLVFRVCPTMKLNFLIYAFVFIVLRFESLITELA